MTLPKSRVLLKPNRRALIAGCLPPVVIVACCLGIMSNCRPDNPLGALGFAVCGLVLVFCLVMTMGLATMVFLPRVAVTSDHLLVYLRGYHPYRVPLDAVECFFQGQSDSALGTANTDSTSIVVRLAERAPEWHQQKVKPSLGEWDNGYIIIRGTWCEKISETKLRTLNSELANVKRAKRNETAGD